MHQDGKSSSFAWWLPFSFTWSVFMERFCEKLTREVDLREESSVLQMTESLDFKVMKLWSRDYMESTSLENYTCKM